MESIFFNNANKWTQKTLNHANEQKYLQAWLDSAIARINYIADMIINICATPFALIRVLFSSLETLYTWGHQTKNLTQAINDLYNFINNSLSSFVGIISISQAIKIRKENNLKKLYSFSIKFLVIYIIAQALFKVDGFKLHYNFDHGFMPGLYWNFNHF